MDNPECLATVPKAARTRPLRQPSADMTRQLINYESAEEFEAELDEQIEHSD